MTSSKLIQYTKNQERTLEYLDIWESKEILSNNYKYLCSCSDCKVEETYSSAGTVSALFMTEHVGHLTFVKKLY